MVTISDCGVAVEIGVMAAGEDVMGGLDNRGGQAPPPPIPPPGPPPPPNPGAVTIPPPLMQEPVVVVVVPPVTLPEMVHGLPIGLVTSALLAPNTIRLDNMAAAAAAAAAASTAGISGEDL